MIRGPCRNNCHSRFGKRFSLLTLTKSGMYVNWIPRVFARSFNCWRSSTNRVKSISSQYPKCGIWRAAVIAFTMAFWMPLMGSVTSAGTCPASLAGKIFLAVRGGTAEIVDFGVSDCFSKPKKQKFFIRAKVLEHQEAKSLSWNDLWVETGAFPWRVKGGQFCLRLSIWCMFCPCGVPLFQLRYRFNSGTLPCTQHSGEEIHFRGHPTMTSARG